MRIKIQGFRCHTDLEYHFSNGSLILLKGPSGSGKTTVFQGIMWCLFGGMKNVYSNLGGTMCAVTLQFNTFTIYRQKKPELLKLTIRHNVFEDDVAQQMINQTFGDHDLWQTCCYIPQGHRCQLLSGSNHDRMMLLNQLSFSMDDPETYISRIGTELKALNLKYTTLELQYNTEIQRFTQELEQHPVELGSYLPDQEYQQLETQLSKAKLLEPVLARERLEHHQIRGTYNALSDSLASVNQQLSVMSNPSDQDLEQLSVKIQELDHQLNQLTQRDQLQLKISHNRSQYQSVKSKCPLALTQGLTPGLNQESTKRLTPQDLWTVSTQEQRYLENVTKCQKLGYVYHPDLKHEIDKLHQEINSLASLEQTVKTQRLLQNLECQLQDQRTAQSALAQQEVGLTHQQDQLINLRQTYVLPDLKVMEQELHQGYTDYQQLLKASELLQCPHCGKSIKYHANKLHPVNSQPVSFKQLDEAKQRYQQLQSQYQAAQKMTQEYHDLNSNIQQLDKKKLHLADLQREKTQYLDQLQTQIQSLRSVVGDRKIPGDIDQQLKTLRYKFSVLSSIEFIAQPDISSKVISSMLELQKLDDEHHQLLDQLNNTHDVAHLQTETTRRVVAQLKLDYATKSKERTRYQGLLDQQVALEKRLQAITLNPNIDEQYSQVVEQIKSLDITLAKAKRTNELIARQTELEKQRDIVMAMVDDMTALQTLHQTAIRVECQQLQATVDNINMAMTDIFQTIFEDPINVNLQLYKTLKTDNRMKPSVNLSIQYRGAEYDNINQLSGGEADRISLGLVLALNRVSSSPIIMLDECLSSLDGNLREACLRALRTCVGVSKTVIMINHEDIEGHYDQVITVR